MNKNLLMNLDLRLGYKDEITLSRDEYNSLLKGDVDRINDLEGDIESLESDIEDLQDENSGLESQIEDLTIENNKLKEKIKQLEEKNND